MFSKNRGIFEYSNKKKKKTSVKRKCTQHLASLDIYIAINESYSFFFLKKYSILKK